MKTTMQVEGFKELDNLLKELPTATSKNVLRRAARKALAPVMETARSLVPTGPDRTKKGRPIKGGGLKRSLKIATRLSRRQASLARKQSAVEGKSSITLYGGPSAFPHAHLVEFGTRERVKKKTGQKVGRMPPQPFMRPAWDRNKDQALTLFRTDIWSEIEKATKRLARKAARAAAKSAGGA